MSRNITEAAPVLQLDRRELLKVGAGAMVAAGLGAGGAGAQESAQGEGIHPAGSMRVPGEIAPFTGPGYRYPGKRLGFNGPMDDTTAKIVKFVHDFKPSDVTPSAKRHFDKTMIDSLSAIISGFELEEPRLAAQMAKMCPAGELKCTVLGYGVSTTPELATFANGSLIRETDYNDTEYGGSHNSILIPAALSIGEAFHRSGAEVMAAIVIAYELFGVPSGGEAVVSCMAAAKLMDLDEDRLANALSIALTPHVALNKGVGAMSMWKNLRSAEATKCGVWAALLARQGMTGPPQPYEGRGGLWSTQRGNISGMGREFTLPIRQDTLGIEGNWFKRRPAEASSQGILYIMKDIRAWVKPEEVASIHFDTSYGVWEEICDAPKWDPRNRQTADHSLPYIIARALIDGDIYIDSYEEAKFMDPLARDLMNKTTIGPVNGWIGLGMGRMTITKKSGETKVFDTYDGNRQLQDSTYPQMTDDEMRNKLTRVCAYQKVSTVQRDEAFKVWGDLASVKDFADAMKLMANFGQPKAL